MSEPNEDPNAAADAAVGRAVARVANAQAADLINRINTHYPGASMMLAYLEAQSDAERATSQSYRESLGAWCAIMRDARDVLKGGLAK